MNVGFKSGRRSRHSPVHRSLDLKAERKIDKPLADDEVEGDVVAALGCLATGDYESMEFLNAIEEMTNLVSCFSFRGANFVVEHRILDIISGIAFSEMGEYYRNRALKIISVVLGDFLGQFDDTVREFLPKLALALQASESKVVSQALKVMSVIVRSESIGRVILEEVPPSLLLNVLSVHYLNKSVYKQIQIIVYILASNYNVDRFVEEFVSILAFTFEKMPVEKAQWAMYTLSFLAQSREYAQMIQRSHVIMSVVLHSFEGQNVDHISVASWIIAGLAENGEVIGGINYTQLFLCMSVPDNIEAQYSTVHAVSVLVGDQSIACECVDMDVVTHFLSVYQVGCYEVCCEIFEALQKIIHAISGRRLETFVVQGGFEILLESLAYDDMDIVTGSLKALSVLASLHVQTETGSDIIEAEIAEKLPLSRLEELLSHEVSCVAEMAATFQQTLKETHGIFA